MAGCEKCWSDAYMRSFNDPTKGQAEHYTDLIKERKSNPCTREQQAGIDARVCPRCELRTIHQFTGECLSCGYKESNR